MPTLGFHVAEDSELKKQVLRRVADTKNPSTSAYVRKLVIADLNGGAPPNAMAETILVDLTRDLLGKIDAEEMTRVTSGLDQRRELRGLLASYIEDRTKSRRPAHAVRKNFSASVSE